MDRWNVAAKVAAASSAVLAVGLLLTGFFAWRATDRKVLGLQLQQASAQLDGNLALARAMSRPALSRSVASGGRHGCGTARRAV